MTSLQSKIADIEYDLKYTKNRYTELIEDLKNTYMERKEYFDKESPLVLKSELNKMRMAYDFLKERAERYDFNSGVEQQAKWKSDEKNNYYCVWDKDYKTCSGTKPSYILYKKYIKELPGNILSPIWKKEVQENKTVQGFSSWLERKSNDEIIESFTENLFEINEPKLKLKNIIIILPWK